MGQIKIISHLALEALLVRQYHELGETEWSKLMEKSIYALLSKTRRGNYYYYYFYYHHHQMPFIGYLLYMDILLNNLTYIHSVNTQTMIY